MSLKNVISASRRTDIPAFYLNWLMAAIQKGSLETENPFYPAQKRTVMLSPDHVEWIVFWSRNYQHFLKHSDFFNDYKLFFHFTILSQSKLEKNSISKEKALNQVEQLAIKYSPNQIIWRYDPLVFWQENNILKTNLNLNEFEFLCKEISQLGIKRCYMSFAYPYSKFKRRFYKSFPDDQLLQISEKKQLQIADEMQLTAAEFGIELHSCCNDTLLNAQLKKGRCIDGNLLNQINKSKTVSVAQAATRENCGCTKAIDIGSYRQQPCAFGCSYCYANPG